MSYTGDMRSIWWLTLFTTGLGVVATGIFVHTMRPYVRLLVAGLGLGVIVLAVLGAAAVANASDGNDDL